MSEEFCLSEKIYARNKLHIRHVKEFLRRGNDLITDLEFGRITIQEFRERFNKNAGEKLQ